MANEPIYDVASLDCKSKLCSFQTVVETRLLPMGGVSISKVLSYSAKSFAAVTDVFTKEARLYGKVAFKVLFLDLEGQIRVVEATPEFTDKINDDSIIGGKPQILCRILDIDIISVAADEIKLAAIVEIDLFDNVSNRIKFLQFGGEDIYTNDERLDFCRFVAKRDSNIKISDEITIEGERILLVEPVIIPLNCEAGTDSVTLQGEVVTNILTQKQDQILSYKIVTPYKEEIEAINARVGNHTEASVSISSFNAVLKGEEESKGCILDLELALEAYVYSEDSILPITDAFSINSDLAINFTDVEVIKNRKQKTIFEKVEGVVTLENDMPVFDKILASTASKLNLANCYILDENLVLEGMVTSAVLYYSAETGTKNSVDIEIPFSITSDKIEGSSVVCAFGEVTELNAKIRRGNELDLKAEIAVSVSTAEKSSKKIISELNVGPAVLLPESAISLHIAKNGQSLWEVAKALRTTPELILTQNPDIELPLKGGERLAVYRHLKK